jgi:hypothetical protein
MEQTMTDTKVLYKPISDLIDDYEIYCCGEHARGCVGEIPKAELAAVGVPVFDRDDFVYAIAYGEILRPLLKLHSRTLYYTVDVFFFHSSRLGQFLDPVCPVNLILRESDERHKMCQHFLLPARCLDIETLECLIQKICQGRLGMRNGFPYVAMKITGFTVNFAASARVGTSEGQYGL